MAKFIGTWLGEVIVGTDDDDKIKGRAGHDTLSGLAGADRILGGAGEDVLLGGDGNDRLHGGANAARLDGDTGNDDLDGGDGHDVLEGGGGDDLLRGGEGDVLIDGGNGNDILSGGAGRDTLLGGHGNDKLFGGIGNDWLSGGGGHDWIKGGDGKDYALGGGGNDNLFGEVGNDRLKGGLGNDRLFGGTGDDKLSGGRGRDKLVGGAGDDKVKGGRGDDKALYDVADNIGATDLYKGGGGIDTLTLTMSNANWFAPAVQADIADYLQFLADHTDPITGQADGAAFQFTAFDLTARQFEQLRVFVDGVELDPADDPVTAVDDAVTLSEDAGATGFASVLGNDDVPDLAYSVTLVSGPAEGLLSFNAGTPGNPDGSFSFDPNGAFDDLAVGETRDVSFTYEVTDANGDTDQATVTITVEGENDAPTLAAGTAAATEDGPTVDVALAALGDDVDSDDDGTSLGYAVTGAPGEGSATIQGTTLAFDPGSDFQDLGVGETRDVTIEVTATDSHGATAVNDIVVTVTGTNDAPTVSAGNSVHGIPEWDDASAQSFDSGANLVLFDDPDVHDRVSITSAPTGDIAWSGGTLDPGVAAALQSGFTAETAGSQPVPGSTTWQQQFSGVDLDFLAEGETITWSHTITATDGEGASATDVVNFTITGANDAPEAEALAVSGDEDSPITGTVTASDVDSGAALGYALDSGPANGTVTVNPDGSFSYQGDADFHGTDSFVFIVEDEHGATDTETVTVTVSPVNDDPTANDGSGAVTEDGTLTATGSLGAADVDGDTLGYTVSGGGTGTYGSLVVDAAGDWTYTLDNAAANVQALDSGDAVLDSFTVTVDDGSGGVTTAAVDITVNGVDDDPLQIGIVGAERFSTFINDASIHNAEAYSGNPDDYDVIILNRTPGTPDMIDWVDDGGLLITEWNAAEWALETANLVDANEYRYGFVETDHAITFTSAGIDAGLSNGVGPSFSSGGATQYFRGFTSIGADVDILAVRENGEAVTLGAGFGSGSVLVRGYDWQDRSYSAADGIDALEQVLLNSLQYDYFA